MAGFVSPLMLTYAFYHSIAHIVIDELVSCALTGNRDTISLAQFESRNMLDDVTRGKELYIFNGTTYSDLSKMLDTS